MIIKMIRFVLKRIDILNLFQYSKNSLAQNESALFFWKCISENTHEFFQFLKPQYSKQKIALDELKEWIIGIQEVNGFHLRAVKVN